MLRRAVNLVKSRRLESHRKEVLIKVEIISLVIPFSAITSDGRFCEVTVGSAVDITVVSGDDYVSSKQYALSQDTGNSKFHIDINETLSMSIHSREPVRLIVRLYNPRHDGEIIGNAILSLNSNDSNEDRGVFDFQSNFQVIALDKINGGQISLFINTTSTSNEDAMDLSNAMDTDANDPIQKHSRKRFQRPENNIQERPNTSSTKSSLYEWSKSIKQESIKLHDALTKAKESCTGELHRLKESNLNSRQYCKDLHKDLLDKTDAYKAVLEELRIAKTEIANMTDKFVGVSNRAEAAEFRMKELAVAVRSSKTEIMHLTTHNAQITAALRSAEINLRQKAESERTLQNELEELRAKYKSLYERIVS